MFWSVFDLPDHYRNLRDEQGGEENGEEAEGGLHRTGTYVRYGNIYRHEVLYDPWLPAHLGHYPSQFTGEVGQRYREESDPQEPAVALKSLPPVKADCQL